MGGKVRAVVLAAAVALAGAARGADRDGKADEPAKPRANPFFAFCMDTHDSRKRNLAQQAQLLKELGYDGAGHLWLEGLADRLRTLDAAGLKLFQVYVRVSIAPGKRPYDPRLGKAVPLLKGRGVMLAVLIEGLRPSQPAGDPRAVKIVREIADVARPSKVKVALYPHAGFWLERVDDALRVARKADRPNVGVMFNLCHWLKAEGGKDLRPLLTRARRRLLAVGIHGADAAAEIRAGKGNWIQPLDSGSFDVFALLKTLRDLGYRGPIGLQCWGLRGDARDHLARSIAAWRRLNRRLDHPSTRGVRSRPRRAAPVGGRAAILPAAESPRTITTWRSATGRSTRSRRAARSAATGPRQP